MTSHAEARIRARIAAARRKTEQRKRRRAELDEQRTHGLEARHAAKMRRWTREET